MATQGTLFLTREEKQEILDAAVLPLPGSTPRTARAVKRLIWAIETTPEDSRIAEILAARMGCSPRSCVRAIRAAESLGVLQTRQVPGDASYYRIDWTVLARLKPQMSPLTTKCHPCHPNVTPDISMSPLTFESLSAKACESPAKQVDSEQIAIRHAGCDAGAGAMHVMNEMNVCMHASGEGTEGKKTRRGALGPGGWPERITAETLRSPRAIQRLWEFAVAREWVEADKREEFHALACCVRRLAKDSQSMRNPGGAFTTRVKGADWLCASSADYAQARREIAGLEGGPVESGSNPAPPAKLLEVPPVDLEARRTRAEQVRQLLTRST